MKLLKIPDWWDSIRAILAFVLCSSYCCGVLIIKLPDTQLAGLKELSLMALTFYFVLKKRPEENGGAK